MGSQGDGDQDFGYLAVVLDDMLFAAKPVHTEQLVEALQGAWTCSPAEFVTKEGSMLFFGFELSMEEDGAIRLSQVRRFYERDERWSKGVESRNRVVSCSTHLS